jgi:hypothetical protein
MVNILKRFVNKLGIDSAVFYTVLARIIQAAGGVFSMFFIAKYLSINEQGYYFTFGSILAIQIFFELGLSGIITQFVAHENAHLSFDGKNKLKGNNKNLSRISSLLRFCIKIFGTITFFLILILIISGHLFFNKYGKININISWQIPWLILAINTGLNFFLAPLFAFLEGLGKVKQIAKIRLFQQITYLICLYLFLIFKFKLYSSPMAGIISFMLPLLWVYFSEFKLFAFIWNQLSKWEVNYKLEIFPYQWRIALSWMSGFLIFHLFNPVAFATEGAKIAGQMGMTLAVLNGVLSLSMSWISTKVPKFSEYIATKKYKRLDLIFNKTVFQSSLVCLLGLVILNSCIFALQYYGYSIAERFLSFYS